MYLRRCSHSTDARWPKPKTTKRFSGGLARPTSRPVSSRSIGLPFGAYLVTQQQWEEATRALLEAIDRDPTDFLSINRLLATLKALNKPEEYEAWKQRWTALTGTVTENNKIPEPITPNVEAMDQLASYLNSIDRKLEAIMWKSLESHYRNLPPEARMPWLLERQKQIVQGTGFPDRESRLCGMSLDAYPLPEHQDRGNLGIDEGSVRFHCRPGFSRGVSQRRR